jgi:hypothetical protein
VTQHRQGREVRYSVRVERVDQAARSMLRLANAWDGRLRRIKRMAESLHRETEEENPLKQNPKSL